MLKLEIEAGLFTRSAERRSAEARQRVALRLMCGIDLDASLDAGTEERARVAERVRRALRCERLKGLQRHWSYDLNRHIALKQALDRLTGAGKPS